MRVLHQCLAAILKIMKAVWRAHPGADDASVKVREDVLGSVLFPGVACSGFDEELYFVFLSFTPGGSARRSCRQR